RDAARVRHGLHEPLRQRRPRARLDRREKLGARAQPERARLRSADAAEVDPLPPSVLGRTATRGTRSRSRLPLAGDLPAAIDAGDVVDTGRDAVVALVLLAGAFRIALAALRILRGGVLHRAAAGRGGDDSDDGSEEREGAEGGGHAA